MCVSSNLGYVMLCNHELWQHNLKVKTVEYLISTFICVCAKLHDSIPLLGKMLVSEKYTCY